MKKITLALLAALLCVSFTVTAQGQDEEGVTTIVFGDVSWDSVQVHNRIAAFIIENGMDGYKADYIPGDTMPILNGIIQGDIDVDMESWHSNYMEVYEKGMETGEIVDLGQNMPDAPQGWWLPRYLVEGPDAPAPDLKSIADLPKYAHLFPDPEDRSKGLIYGGVAGWMVTEISEDLFSEYGLEDTYNFRIAGSNAALAGTMAGAYEKKEGWVGYYWAPTAILGRLDMILLEGTEHDPAIVNILVNKSMLEKAPDVVEFLRNYSTSVAENNEFLAVMDDNGYTTEETAEWFLKNKEETWTSWVSEEVAERVKAAL
jgi:glycine betaine/proline transport system substrate-binding protein